MSWLILSRAFSKSQKMAPTISLSFKAIWVSLIGLNTAYDPTHSCCFPSLGHLQPKEFISRKHIQVLKLNHLRTWTWKAVNIRFVWLNDDGHIWGGADKSLARPVRKQATSTKLGIYSTDSPRSSINFLALCSNFCKPLKKSQKAIRPTRSPRQQWPRRTKNGDLSIVSFRW